MLLLKEATKDSPDACDVREVFNIFSTKGTYYTKKGSNVPNVYVRKDNYELTDEAIIQSWPFSCGGEGAYA